MEKTSDWVKEVVQTIDDNQIDVHNVCHLLKAKKLSIESVVTDLGPFLTNTETKERSKGVCILSTILYSLPNNYFTSKEVEVLTQFYCDRLKDHYSVVPNLLKGLSAIVNSEKFSTNLSSDIFNGLVKELSVQQFSVSERFLVFQIVTKLFERSAEVFKSIRSDFIYGLIQLIEGERDPRCLLLVFRLTHSVTTTLQLEPFAEDLFEVISCYFPVLFTPPPNDEYGITKEELSESLNQCLSSSSEFSQFIFPLILEKLESELITAKIDSYKLLINIFPNYGFEKIQEFIYQLWTAIRIDSLKSKFLRNEVSDFALKALTSMSDSIASNQKSFDSFIEIIWKDISNAFVKPELDLMESALDIVLATISTNYYAFDKFVEKLIPLLLKTYTFCQKELFRIQIIDSMTKLLEYSQKLSKKPKNLVNSESLFTLLTSIIISESESDEMKNNVIQCLKQLIGSMQMNEQHWSEISHILHFIFDNYFNCEKLMQNTFHLIESIASLNSVLVQNITKYIIGRIDSGPTTEVERNRLNCILRAFPFISNDMNSFKVISILSVQKIKDNTYQMTENERIFSNNLIENISKSFDKLLNTNSDEMIKTFLLDNFLDPMIQHCIHISICTDNKSGTSVNMELIDGILPIIGKIAANINSKSGQKLFIKLTKFSILGSVNQLLPSVPPTCFCSYVSGPQFLESMNSLQAIIVFKLLFQLISNLKYEITSRDSTELLDKLIEFAINDRYNNQEICVLSFKSIGAFVNRFDSRNQVLNDKLREVLTSLKNNLSESRVSEEKKLLIIDVLIWMTKGLVISKHLLRKEFIDLIINLCEDDKQIIRTKVSQSFQIIHKTEDNCLKEENNANVTLLFNQRFYFETFESLLNLYLKYKDLNSDKAQTFLTALLTQLNYITKAVFRTELKRLLPMLLDAINSESETNQKAALDSITQLLIDKNKEMLNPCLKSCASNCVKLSLNSPKLSVRRSALNCLAQIADTFDDSELHFLRNQIVRDLRKTLNDRKRIVRRSAVRARCKWILVGQPGNDNKIN